LNQSDRQAVPDHPLQGELVRLRALEPSDAALLNPLFCDPDVLSGLEMTWPQSEAGFEEWVRVPKPDGVAVVIETLDGREAIGACDLRGISLRSRSAEFGIWVAKPRWNQGYGTDATRTMVRYGFDQLNLHRISLHVYATNLRAVRAYEKVGFVVEGTLRDAQFLGGRHIDVIAMAILSDRG
jgi:RimJ/RimL family protein N-acetyltransferase